MILLIFIIVSSFLIFLSYKENKTLINIISLLIFPYLIIIPINNLYFVNNGFFLIDNKTIIFLLLSMISYFIGSSLIVNNYNIRTIDYQKSFIDIFNINLMTKTLYIISIVCSLRLILLIKNGNFNSLNFDDTEGLMGHGPFGHILLIGYILTPFVFLYWTFSKKIYYLLPVLLIIICSFSSLVKYHVIGLLLMIYLFIGLYNKRLILKGSFIAVILIFLIFIANYSLSFFILGAEVEDNFYLSHFWKYAGGSIIYNNYLVEGSIQSNSSIIYKILTYIVALPNMFLSLLDVTLFPKENYIQMLDLSHIGEQGNVVTAFGDLYPSNPDLLSFITYFIIIAFIGFFSKYIYIKRIKKSLIRPDIFIVVFLTFFVFLSFFGTYAGLPAPWELLIWSLIIPPLFYKKKTFKFISLK